MKYTEDNLANGDPMSGRKKSCYAMSHSSTLVNALSSHAFQSLLSPASSSGSPGNSEKSFQRLPH